MLKPNIGILNALLRITFGLTFLSYGIARLIRKPGRESSLFLIMLSAMKVAEGIVRYCPVVALMENKNVMDKINSNLNKNLNLNRNRNVQHKDEEAKAETNFFN